MDELSDAPGRLLSVDYRVGWPDIINHSRHFLTHADDAVEHGTLFNEEDRRDDIAGNPAGSPDLDLGASVQVPADLAIDDATPDIYIRIDLPRFAYDQRAGLRKDFAVHPAVYIQLISKAYVASDFDTLADEPKLVLFASFHF
jgi:hypothetical protein